MKLLLLLLILPTTLFCQKIKVNAIDKFTNQKIIETDSKHLRAGFSCGISVSYRAVDTFLLIKIVGYGCGVGVIGRNEKFIFLLSDKSTVTVKSKGIQDYTIRSSTMATVRSYSHEYYITKEDIKKLSETTVESVRTYSTDGYEDIEIKKKDGLMELSKIFLQAVTK